MEFVVSSSELLNRLQAVSKVISTRNTLPILDNFLFNLEGNTLEITASDLETTVITRHNLDNATEDGSIAIPAKFLTDYLSKFSDQPLTFNISTENMTIRIVSETGESTIMGYDADDFPQQPTLREDAISQMNLPADLVLQGIAKTIFSVGDDELRPVMNGILFEFNTENITFVATDAHKLARYRRTDAQAEQEGTFILPKKPAALLRSVLAKEQGNVEISFDDKNAIFKLSEYTMVCRLAEGKYPAYNSVIPTENSNKLVIDRADFYGALRRVAMFTNQATNLIKLELTDNQVIVLAQDHDFSISGRETLKCQYDGEQMSIGFKSGFIHDIVANLPSTDICVEMSDPSRPCLVLPVQKDNESEDLLMLLMPLNIG
jgi:DNA polymerase-3 subunit beta